MKNCLSNGFIISKNERRQLLQENKLLSIRAALDRHLRSPRRSHFATLCSLTKQTKK